MSRHVIWDWNCTLFDDFPAIFQATDRIIQSFGAPPLTIERYHETHARPFSLMYQKLLGRPFTEEEFYQESPRFFGYYMEDLPNRSMRPDANDSIMRLAELGISQSILSMWDENMLRDLLTKIGIDKHMVYLQGVEMGDAHTKEDHIHKHLDKVSTCINPEGDLDIVMIGDTVNDFEAASHAGIEVVLVTGGQDSEKSLRETGAPVAESLTEAVDIVVNG